MSDSRALTRGFSISVQQVELPLPQGTGSLPPSEQKRRARPFPSPPSPDRGRPAPLSLVLNLGLHCHLNTRWNVHFLWSMLGLHTSATWCEILVVICTSTIRENDSCPLHPPPRAFLSKPPVARRASEGPVAPGTWARGGRGCGAGLGGGSSARPSRDPHVTLTRQCLQSLNFFPILSIVYESSI